MKKNHLGVCCTDRVDVMKGKRTARQDDFFSGIKFIQEKGNQTKNTEYKMLIKLNISIVVFS